MWEGFLKANKIIFWSPNAILICLLTVAMLIPATLAATNPPADLEARRKALNDLLHERWEYTMRTSPIYASIQGDRGLD